MLLRPAPDDPATPQRSEVTDEVVTRLRDGSVRVEVIVPEAQAWDVGEVATQRPRHDLYVLWSATPLALALAAALDAAGARLVNPFRPERFKDKAVTAMLLAAAGVPVPPSWLAAGPAPLRPLLTDGPLVTKPLVGSMGQGVRRVAQPADLDDLEDRSGSAGEPRVAAAPLLAQREAASSGRDLKVYVVGDWVAAITRQYPPKTEADKRGTPAAISPAVRAAALACGRAIGFELYGVDVLSESERAGGSDGEAGSEPFVVVDVNNVPTYKGVRGAPQRLAGYLAARARGAAPGGGGVP
jgi:ribosomal protein S6--L-glutamate ligase